MFAEVQLDSREDSERVCKLAGYDRLCASSELRNHHRCVPGWLSDAVGYWARTTLHPSCGAIGFNPIDESTQNLTAYCCRGPSIRDENTCQQYNQNTNACDIHDPENPEKIHPARVLVAFGTEEREIVGLNYTFTVLEGFRQAMRSLATSQQTSDSISRSNRCGKPWASTNAKCNALIMDMHVFLLPSSDAKQTHKNTRDIGAKCYDEGTVGFHCKQHILKDETTPPEKSKSKGIWREITDGERRHNAHMLSILQHMRDQCTEFEKLDPCRETFVLLTEDDFMPCPWFAQELQTLLSHTCIYHKELMGLRISTGGAGIIIPCTRMAVATELFQGWILSKYTDQALAMGLPTRQQRPYFSYRYNMLKHTEIQLSNSNVSNLQTSLCREKLYGAGILAEEHFTESCLQTDSAFSPCEAKS